jgi:hypothetical protein
MLKIISKLISIFFDSNTDPIIDHVPANKLPEDPKKKKAAVNMAARKIAQAREEAKARHGRDFHCDSKITRATPPSLMLNEIHRKVEAMKPSTNHVIAKRGINSK